MLTFIYRHISEIINISEVINCFRIVDQPEDIPLSTLCSYDFWIMAYCKKGKVEEYDEDGQVVTLSDGDVMNLNVIYLIDNSGIGFTSFQLTLG